MTGDYYPQSQEQQLNELPLFQNVSKVDLFSVEANNRLNNGVNVAELRISQKQRIYQALIRLGRATQNELSRATNIPRHLVPDRLIHLANEHMVRICGSMEDAETRKTVNVYEVC